jgi:NADH dehydrogenase [ubiquinone] 1 alpha subcomplex assembly factor 7
MLQQVLAVWFLTRWAMLGSPDRLRLIELGPGRGTLIRDILNVRTVPKQYISWIDVTLGHAIKCTAPKSI